MSKERRLDGAVVVLTRRREDNAALARELREHGAEVIELPCTRTEPLEDARELADRLRALGPTDLLVLTSRAGADAVGLAVPRGSLTCGLAAVGEATAARATAVGLTVRFVASRADGATLGRELPLPRGTVLLARSDIADAALPAALRARGADVRDVAAYRTIASVEGDPTVIPRAVDRSPVTIVVASPSAVAALESAIDVETLRRAAFVAIGARTAARVAQRIRTAIIAAGPTADAIVRAVPSATAEEAVT